MRARSVSVCCWRGAELNGMEEAPWVMVVCGPVSITSPRLHACKWCDVSRCCIFKEPDIFTSNRVTGVLLLLIQRTEESLGSKYVTGRSSSEKRQQILWDSDNLSRAEKYLNSPIIKSLSYTAHHQDVLNIGTVIVFIPQIKLPTSEQ